MQDHHLFQTEGDFVRVMALQPDASLRAELERAIVVASERFRRAPSPCTRRFAIWLMVPACVGRYRSSMNHNSANNGLRSMRCTMTFWAIAGRRWRRNILPSSIARHSCDFERRTRRMPRFHQLLALLPTPAQILGRANAVAQASGAFSGIRQTLSSASKPSWRKSKVPSRGTLCTCSEHREDVNDLPLALPTRRTNQDAP